MLFIENIEKKIYTELKKHKECIYENSLCFNLDRRFITSLLYVEHIQYDVSKIRNIIHKSKKVFLDLLYTIEHNKKVNNILDVLNFSEGFTHIKPNTAKFVYIKRKISKNDVLFYRKNPDISIKITCAIIREHIDMWKSEIDLSDNIPILATLYNISNFKNKKPHKNPRSGGSVMDNIVDGGYKEDMCFGDRVLMVYNSESMENFWKKD